MNDTTNNSTYSVTGMAIVTTAGALVPNVAMLVQSENNRYSVDQPMTYGWTQDSAGLSFREQVVLFPLSPFAFYPNEVVISDSYVSRLGPLSTGLRPDYQELGQALVQLREGDAEDWAIDETVFSIATYVASALMDYAQPAPRLFSNGPKSVVFHWVEEDRNTYLTVSENYVSALVSSPEKIETRRQVPVSMLLGAAHILSIIQAESLAPIVTRDGKFVLLAQAALP